MWLTGVLEGLLRRYNHKPQPFIKWKQVTLDEALALSEAGADVRCRNIVASPHGEPVWWRFDANYRRRFKWWKRGSFDYVVRVSEEV